MPCGFLCPKCRYTWLVVVALAWPHGCSVRRWEAERTQIGKTMLQTLASGVSKTRSLHTPSKRVDDNNFRSSEVHGRCWCLAARGPPTCPSSMFWRCPSPFWPTRSRQKFSGIKNEMQGKLMVTFAESKSRKLASASWSFFALASLPGLPHDIT